MLNWRSMMFAGLFGLAMVAGCSSDDWGGSSKSDRDDDARTARGDVDRASGAAKKLPTDARVVDEGRDTTLRYEAREAGTVHLFDDSANMVVFSKKVKDGDRITVDPDKNRIEVNGAKEASIDLKSTDRFQLYFQPR
jgi:hypothetical protein